ncbi:MAG: GDP-mannose 4,6-dehydratase [Deltaproteobacteria bacterium]|nr:GDP-mannose 4,6-dehydratase [Deltaproteobacteria bacterium]
MNLNNSFENKNIVITGGLGFIGSNLAERLCQFGANVTLLDSMLPDYGGNERNVEKIKDKVKISYTDMRDPHSLPYIVKNSDYIFNLAGQISHIDSMNDPIQDLEINQKAQVYFLEAVRKYAKNSIVVHASTRQIYGKTIKTPTDENHPIAPTDVNGINKLGGELYHTLYSKVYGIKTVSLRLTNTYGPRQLIRHNRQGFIGWFMNRALLGEEIVLYGDGSQIRDFTYVDDVVDGLLLTSINEKAWGNVYNLGGIRPYTLLETANILKNLNPNLTIRFIPFPEERKKIDIGNYIADYNKIKSEINWKPKVDLPDGLEKMFNFYKGKLENYL